MTRYHAHPIHRRGRSVVSLRVPPRVAEAADRATFVVGVLAIVFVIAIGGQS